jgi:hypothetical protein
MKRVKMTTEDAQALRERPVARGKAAAKQREADRALETDVKVIRTRKTDTNAKPELHGVPGNSIIGVAQETMARVYGEIYSGMSTHDEEQNVILDISEEVYILALTMVVGNDHDIPRMGLTIKEDTKISTTMKTCKGCS